MSAEQRSAARRCFGVTSFWWVIPLCAGIILASLMPCPVVGLIRLFGEIGPLSAGDLIAQISYARRQPEVRAVVLVLDSPGGTAVDTEAVYLELMRLRQSKPVVGLVTGMAASGAYYLAVGTDYIFAHPTSDVGNVGVITELPAEPSVWENVLATGPYKMWGSPRDTAMRRMEIVKQGFYQAVQLGRGGALQIEQETLLRGEVWLGSEALRLGLIDELGSQAQAVEKAAQMARIAHYGVADLYGLAGLSPRPTPTSPPEEERAPRSRQPGLYLLYIPPEERRWP